MTTPSDFWAKLTLEESYGAKVAPPAPADDLRRWETEHGVSLPTTLAQALGVQGGGYVCGTGNLVIESIDAFLPLDSARWAYVEDEVDGNLIADRSKQFVIGDLGGCAVVLDYNVGDEPRVLSIWHGMGAVLRDDDEGTFDEFLQSVRDAHAEADENDEDDLED